MQELSEGLLATPPCPQEGSRHGALPTVRGLPRRGRPLLLRCLMWVTNHLNNLLGRGSFPSACTAAGDQALTAGLPAGWEASLQPSLLSRGLREREAVSGAGAGHGPGAVTWGVGTCAARPKHQRWCWLFPCQYGRGGSFRLAGVGSPASLMGCPLPLSWSPNSSAWDSPAHCGMGRGPCAGAT